MHSSPRDALPTIQMTRAQAEASRRLPLRKAVQRTCLILVWNAIQQIWSRLAENPREILSQLRTGESHNRTVTGHASELRSLIAMKIEDLSCGRGGDGIATDKPEGY